MSKMTVNSLLDLQGDSPRNISTDKKEEYTRILENPDLLGRLYRIFVYKNIRPGYWKELFNNYLVKHESRGSKWVNNKRTNLERTLFEYKTVSWDVFLEGLVIIQPAFPDMTMELYTHSSAVQKTALRITSSTAILNDYDTPPLPAGEVLIPIGTYRSPMEPFPIKVVRNLISLLGTHAELKRVIRENLKGVVPDNKLNGRVNTIYQSAIHNTMTWKCMMAIIFAVGYDNMVVELKSRKNNKDYSAVVAVAR